jgi:hypothetical protein
VYQAGEAEGEPLVRVSWKKMGPRNTRITRKLEWERMLGVWPCIWRESPVGMIASVAWFSFRCPAFGFRIEAAAEFR